MPTFRIKAPMLCNQIPVLISKILRFKGFLARGRWQNAFLPTESQTVLTWLTPSSATSHEHGREKWRTIDQPPDWTVNDDLIKP